MRSDVCDGAVHTCLSVCLHFLRFYLHQCSTGIRIFPNCVLLMVAVMWLCGPDRWEGSLVWIRPLTPGQRILWTRLIFFLNLSSHSRAHILKLRCSRLQSCILPWNPRSPSLIFIVFSLLWLTIILVCFKKANFVLPAAINGAAINRKLFFFPRYWKSLFNANLTDIAKSNLKIWKL